MTTQARLAKRPSLPTTVIAQQTPDQELVANMEVDFFNHRVWLLGH